ncbi:MAG: UDP-N-acetylmuramate dehydrogenase [Caldimicrobium sp.]
MKWLKDLDKYLEERQILYKKEEELSPHTTIKIGGKTTRTVYPKSEEELIELLEFMDYKEIPFFVIGGGSNLLVSDEGFSGVVVILKTLKGIETVSLEETLRLKVLAGTRINEILRYCYERGFSGFEFLAGVPATLGGAIEMNAGAFGLSTSQFVRKIRLYRNKKVIDLDCREDMWSYRSFKEKGVIVSAELEFIKKEKEEIKRSLREILEKRRATQPVFEKTFGSVFKNPPCCYAGALIEQAGLKGYKVGKAKISEKHANFIVNTGGATAKEVVELMKIAQKKVWEKFHIPLEPEVKFLGISYENNYV